LEADDIAVLDFTLSEGALDFHKLNHPRFDFLHKNIIGIAADKKYQDDALPRRVSMAFQESIAFAR
jgi:hypothetical protein